MSITEYAIKNKAVSYFFIAILGFGGIGAYFVLGQLEDPMPPKARMAIKK